MLGGTRAFLVFAAALPLAACASTPRPNGPEASDRVIPGLDVDVHERILHYDVEGATVEQLTVALDAAAPRVDGRLFRGTTHWNVRWRFRYAPRGAGCAVTDVDVDLRVTTTVPRWEPPPEADPDLVARWSAYRAALDAHEAGHYELAVEAANEIERALRGLRTASCEGLQEEANARGHWVVERYREVQRRYDRETGHGRTQGAWWPPGDLGEDGGIHAGSPER